MRKHFICTHYRKYKIDNKILDIGAIYKPDTATKECPKR